MGKKGRGPIQVYLTETERDRLDAMAAEQGVSRSEILRRGIVRLGRDDIAVPSGPLADLAADGLAIPGRPHLGPPPEPSPIAPLRAILGELGEDRAER